MFIFDDEDGIVNLPFYDIFDWHKIDGLFLYFCGSWLLWLKLLILIGDGTAIIADEDFFEVVSLLWLVMAIIIYVRWFVYLVYPSLVAIVSYLVEIIGWLLLETGVVVERKLSVFSVFANPFDVFDVRLLTETQLEAIGEVVFLSSYFQKLSNKLFFLLFVGERDK